MLPSCSDTMSTISPTDFDSLEIQQQYNDINNRWDLAAETDWDNENSSARLFERSRIKALAGRLQFWHVVQQHHNNTTLVVFLLVPISYNKRISPSFSIMHTMLHVHVISRFKPVFSKENDKLAAHCTNPVLLQTEQNLLTFPEGIILFLYVIRKGGHQQVPVKFEV